MSPNCLQILDYTCISTENEEEDKELLANRVKADLRLPQDMPIYVSTATETSCIIDSRNGKRVLPIIASPF